jgi:hypothetical protein
MSASIAQSVWGMFNGEGGDQLPALTRMEGPFPPVEGSKGWIAIGWPDTGDMRIWKDDYKTYYSKFEIANPDEVPARVKATQANMLWYFAFEMNVGDWVICPCSSEGLLLVGQIVGPYEADWKAAPGLRGDFTHFRPVQWLHVIESNDRRYSRLNRIGQLILSRQNLTVEQLKGIINGEKASRA